MDTEEKRLPGFLAVVGDLSVWLAVGGVLAGLVLGLLSAIEERYLELHLDLLLLDRLRASVWGTLVAGALLFGIGGILLGLGRAAFRGRARWALLAGYVGVLVAAYSLSDLNVVVRTWWAWLPAAERIVFILALGVLVERVLLPGRLVRIPRAVPRWVAAAFLLVPVGLSIAVGVESGERAKALRARNSPNFLFLVVDALRADHVGAYGYERDTTPTIDRLAREGYLFTNAVSNSIATRYTVPAIFAMVYPSVHGIVIDGMKLAPGFVTLAEDLKEAGYATAAWCPNPSLKSVFGFDQGYDLYDDQILNDDPDLAPWQQYETASRMNERTLRWLDGLGDRPWFAYLHYRDPHFPYAPPPDYDGIFYEGEEGKPIRPITQAEYDLQPGGEMIPGGADRNDLEYYIAQYDAEILYTDHQIRALLAALEERGVLENTVVLVSADHGEGFLEHGRWNHGNVLYEEATHVPAIIRLRERTSGVRIDAPVHTFDLSATILDLAGVEPRGKIQAKSLRPLLESRGKSGRPWDYAYVEKKRRAVLRNERFKYLIRKDEPELREELYDLAADPGETKNVADAHPELTRELRARALSIEKMNAELAREVKTGEKMDLDEGTLRELESLGYLK